MKTIIEMAREAGIEWDLIDEDEGQVWYITQAGLKRFAELVRADERDCVMNEPITKAHWQRFENDIRADERERIKLESQRCLKNPSKGNT